MKRPPPLINVSLLESFRANTVEPNIAPSLIDPLLKILQVRYHNLLSSSLSLDLIRVYLVSLQHVLHQSTTTGNY